MDISSANTERAKWRSSRFVASGLGLVLLAAMGGVVAIGVTRANGSAPSRQVTVSATACAPGWLAPRSGRTVFNVENVSRDTVYGVDLLGANQVAVYGEIEMIAPGTTVPMDVVLPPGRYSFECEAFSGATLLSRTEEVSGPPVSDAHPYTPVEISQIQVAELHYRDSLLPVMKQLEHDTDVLRAAIAEGDLSEARRLWLPAHLDYERLGAAYDTFGNFNAKINGRPLGLEGGVHSAHFQGYLRLEYGLWHGQPVSELVPVANALDSAVHGLVKQFPQMLMPLIDLALRTHEILENTLQFELTGKTDEGSHTNLASAWANAKGTALALNAITPLLRQNDPRLLAGLNAGLGAVTAELKSYEHPNRTWTPLQSLTTPEREHLDGSLGALLGQLSLVPDVLDLPIRPDSPND